MVQGYLHKQGRRGYSWKKRWFNVEDGELIYYSDASRTKKLGVLKKGFKVRDETTFVIETHDRVMAVRADTLEEKHKWLQAFGQSSSKGLMR